MKIGKKTIENLKFDGKERLYFDDSLKGFGVRIRKDSSSYIVMYRNNHGQQRKMTLGKTSSITPTEAREQARRILADVVCGNDPHIDKIETRRDLTVPELVQFYISERQTVFKKTTREYYERVLRTRIKPLLSDLYMKDAKARNMQKFYDAVMAGKSLAPQYCKNPAQKHIAFANSAIQLVSSAYEYAISQEMASFNPCSRIKRVPTPNRRFFLDDKGLVLFGQTLNEIAYSKKLYIDAIRLMALTGCRKNEILKLKWKYIDFDNQLFRFPDTKTGAQDRPFGSAAKKFMRGLKLNRQTEDELIFGENKQASKKVEHLFGTYIKRVPGLEGLMPHGLRHTFASMAAALGYSDSVISCLVGHKLNTMTSRYTHLTDTVRAAAADAVSERIAALMNGKGDSAGNDNRVSPQKFGSDESRVDRTGVSSAG